MQMKRTAIIGQLEKTLGEHRNLTTEKEFIEILMTCLLTLKSDEQNDPGGFVMSSHGECERDGIYAPADKDGHIDFIQSSPFNEGQIFPEGNWIQVGFV